MIYHDTDFTHKINKEPHEAPQTNYLYLDELKATIASSRRTFFTPTELNFGKGKKIRGTHGTLIRISGLDSNVVWTKDKLGEIQEAIGSLESPFERIHQIYKDPTDRNRSGGVLSGFEIEIDAPILELESEPVPERFASLIDKAIFVVRDGKYNQESGRFTFDLNGNHRTLSFDDFEGYSLFGKQFISKVLNPKDEEKQIIRKSTCGDFEFEFFIFDFRGDAPPSKTTLKVDRDFIKKHRIYLYRDGIRVFPYGDPQDDWLQIDVLRGKGRAGDYLSNDQTVGCINISQNNNPALEDKTSREGVIERGQSFADFVILIRSLLYYLRRQLKAVHIERDQNLEQKNKQIIPTKLDELVRLLELFPNKRPLELAREILDSYRIQQKDFSEKVNLLQDLASVGISVETTSHDFAVILNQAEGLCEKLVKSLRKQELNLTSLLESLVTLRGFIELLNDILVGIQPIFRVARHGPKNIRLVEQVKIVRHLFEKALNKRGITCEIVELSPLFVYATESIILQALINLFDNSIYWVALPSVTKKKILIELDGEKNTLRFSDSGSGIAVDTAPYIFEPFFSAKESGRGLGLFIARSLLERYKHQISLVVPSESSLKGANFIIEFSSNEK